MSESVLVSSINKLWSIDSKRCALLIVEYSETFGDWPMIRLFYINKKDPKC